MTNDSRWTRLRAVPPGVLALMAGEFTGLLAAASMQLAMAWWIAREGGAADLARYGVLAALAALLATPLLSPAGDRWPKVRVVRAARLGLVLDALLLALLARAGHYDLALLCGCSLLSVACTSLLWPAEASLLPERVAPAQLPLALRWRRGVQAAGGWLGPALAGAVLATAGLAAAMALNLVLGLLAAAAAWCLGPARAPAVAAGRSSWFGEMAAGLRAKWQVRLDRWWTLVGALMMLCLLPATGLLLPLRLQTLGLGAGWFGACQAALSVGLLAGVAGLAPALIGRLGRIGALALAIAACSASLAGLGWCCHPMALAALLIVVGACLAVTQLVGQTHRLLATPEDFRARMNAAHLMVAHLSAAAAPALAGALLQHADVATAYGALAAGFAAGGLLLLAVPGLGPFLRTDHDGVRDWYRRYYPGAFARR